MVFGLLFSLLFATPADAGSCKKVMAERTNAFGEREHGGVVYTDRGHFTAIGTYLDKDQPQLRTMFVQRGVVDTVIPAGTVVDVVLQDGTKFQMPTLGDSEPISNASVSGVFTQWQLAGALPKDTLVAMRNSPIVAARTIVGTLELNIAISSKKYRKRLVALATCFQP